MAISPAEDKVRFGLFELDAQAGELRKNGMRIRLPQQPLQLLMVLLERPGQVVTRDELKERLWPADVFVDFDHGLNKSVQKLREALGDSADSPRYIETIPRTGYRFIAPVMIAPVDILPGNATPSSADAQEPETAPADQETDIKAQPATEPSVIASAAGKRSVRWIPWLALAACMVVLAVAIGWLLHRKWHAAEPIRSLAVLPLDNLSGQPEQDYFAVGMTDELTTMLAKNSTLRIVSRTSVMQYKGAHRPLPEIARELGVDGVIEGRWSAPATRCT